MKRDGPHTFGPVALAFLLIAAFAAGLLVARMQPTETRIVTVPEAEADRREMYSPRVLSDPHFAKRQREAVETLERHCSQSGEMCGEARKAREAYERLPTAR